MSALATKMLFMNTRRHPDAQLATAATRSADEILGQFGELTAVNSSTIKGLTLGVAMKSFGCESVEGLFALLSEHIRSINDKRRSKFIDIARKVLSIVESRREACLSTLHISLVDKEYQDLIKQADGLRDTRRWAEAEFAYWTALQIYPLHRGFIVQYAHCLKEQGKYLDAEANYRTAFALGEVSDDVRSHIEFVARKRGGAFSERSANAVRSYWASAPSDAEIFTIPTVLDDIRDCLHLFLNWGVVPLETLLSLWEVAPTRGALVRSAIG